MNLIIGSDHAGFSLKQQVIPWLRQKGHRVVDIGTHTADEVDFPDIVSDLCGVLQRGEAARGVVVCGTGVGASMAANKNLGIRAALCHDVHSAHQSVEHDDANVLCLGAWIVGEKLALDLLAAYLAAEPSDDEACRRRVAKLDKLDELRR